jgi:hypothetical protein
MWYLRPMLVNGARPRLWPFVLLAILGVFLLGAGVVAAVTDQAELPAVELLK